MRPHDLGLAGTARGRAREEAVAARALHTAAALPAVEDVDAVGGAVVARVGDDAAVLDRTGVAVPAPRIEHPRERHDSEEPEEHTPQHAERQAEAQQRPALAGPRGAIPERLQQGSAQAILPLGTPRGDETHASDRHEEKREQQPEPDPQRAPLEHRLAFGRHVAGNRRAHRIRREAPGGTSVAPVGGLPALDLATRDRLAGIQRAEAHHGPVGLFSAGAHHLAAHDLTAPLGPGQGLGGSPRLARDERDEEAAEPEEQAEGERGDEPAREPAGSAGRLPAPAPLFPAPPDRPSTAGHAVSIVRSPPEPESAFVSVAQAIARPRSSEGLKRRWKVPGERPCCGAAGARSRRR
jgi:hypothetical protein